MAIPQDKSELLKAINLNFDKLLGVLALVPEARTREAGMDGHASGTQMSVCDLLAYLLGWNELVLKWLERDASGQAIDFPETGFKWNELGKLAQKFYGDYAALSYAQLLERLGAARARVVSAIEARDDSQLYGRAWHGKWSMGRMIQFNTSSPYDNARARLRKWLKREGGAAPV